LIEKRRQIARAVEDADDFEGAGVRAVENQIREYRPDAERRTGYCDMRVAHAWHVGELLERLVEALQKRPSSFGATLIEKVLKYFVELSLSPP
jgi:hypothetical protein